MDRSYTKKSNFIMCIYLLGLLGMLFIIGIITIDRKERSESIKEITYKNITACWTLDKKGLAAVTASISAAFRCAFSKAEVVHVHAEGPAVMCWLPRLLGKKVIVTVHGLDWQREKWKGSFGLFQLLLQLSSRSPNSFSCIGIS